MRYPKLPKHVADWFKEHEYTRERNSWSHVNLVTVSVRYNFETAAFSYVVNGIPKLNVPECEGDSPEEVIRKAYALRIQAAGENKSLVSFFEVTLDSLNVVPLNVSRQQLYAWMHSKNEAAILKGINTVNDPVHRAFLCDHLRQVRLEK